MPVKRRMTITHFGIPTFGLPSSFRFRNSTFPSSQHLGDDSAFAGQERDGATGAVGDEGVRVDAE